MQKKVIRALIVLFFGALVYFTPIIFLWINGRWDFVLIWGMLVGIPPTVFVMSFLEKSFQ